MNINIQTMRSTLQSFNFTKLFIEELGWSRPANSRTNELLFEDLRFCRRQVAQLSGVVVFEIQPTDSTGRIPDAKTRAAIHKEISGSHHENLLIFVDGPRSQSLWYWVKRDQGKSYPRDHFFMRGQSGDLFLSKLMAMVFDLSDFDSAGKVPLVEVTSRLKSALDVEHVTKKFYRDFQEQHIAFLDLIGGIESDHDRRWYASVLLNRMMFIYFLQRKFFLDGGDGVYLQNKLAQSKKLGRNLFYGNFLKCLFFEGFAKPEDQRSPEARALLGAVKYLNGGLFLPHRVEQKYPKIAVPDLAFENLLALFSSYSWNLNDTPGGADDEINPDVLGYIFEKYINQKAFGAYYTRTEITEYLCERTIHRLILDAVNTPEIPVVIKRSQYESVADLLLDLDAGLCRQLLNVVLPGLKLLDPACGSGAFLVAAMKTLIDFYSAVVGKIRFLNDRNLLNWLTVTERDHRNIAYYIKKSIIADNLFGVDIMEEAVEICKLRLFLALVSSAATADDLEPLPNIDFNILSGNSLIGLMHVDDAEFKKHNAQGNLFRKSYSEILEEKNRLIGNYRHAATYTEDLRTLRDDIEQRKQQAKVTLDEILLAEFHRMGIKYEQATWNDRSNKPKKTIKRNLTPDDLASIRPFHWGYEFDQVLNDRGGFDAIITNPPWEIFKPNAKEFFEEHSDLVTKKKMAIHDFEREQAKLLRDKDIRVAWLDYLSGYPHVSAFYRSAPQYRNQISVIADKKAGSDINIYKLFTEQCFNLLRPGGQCGIVIPSGIYTDLGAKQLRAMLFERTQITGLFCLENRKEIFENVHRSYKFVALTFAKGGNTKSFPAAFMRLDVAELNRFPAAGAIEISVDLVRRLSPDALSVLEFKNEVERRIAERAARFPVLQDAASSFSAVRFTREIDPTAHSASFSPSHQKELLPLLEGRNIHQYTSNLTTDIRFWVSKREGRRLVLGREPDVGQSLDYQAYRLGFRKIARNTDERTMIATIIYPTFVSENLQTVQVFDAKGERLVSNPDMLFLCAVFNSFTFDSLIRLKVTANMNFFFVYGTQVPNTGTALDNTIIQRAARLICTRVEFDDLAKQVGLKSYKHGATDPAERAGLRSELDGLIAHLYGLTEEEFGYILTTFPLVPEPMKIAAQNAYRDVERGKVK